MRRNISGVAKSGQLKRIQAVLHRDYKSLNRFENRNWEEEIKFIRKGRGGFIPFTISIDFCEEDLISFLKKEYSNPNIMEAKHRIENALKLSVIEIY
ncbi:MAG: hypothetical protein ACM31G_04675 [Flavobacteriales bacterium]